MYNESAKKASMKYRAANIRRLAVEMQISEYELIAQFAEKAGEKMTTYVKNAVRMRMEIEKEQEKEAP